MGRRLEQFHTKEAAERLAACFLEPSKDKRGFICPCGHGEGLAKKKGGEKNTGDGLTFDNRGYWHCFSCNRKGDVVELYQYQHSGVSFKDAVAELEALAGIAPPAPPTPPAKQGKSPEQVKAEFEALTFSPIEQSYRGISPETLNRYGAKLCRAFSNPLKAGTIHGPREAMTFPTAEGCYFVRALEHRAGELCDKWDIGGKAPFNLAALQGNMPVFLVEGVIDALSIIEAGGNAIALSGLDGMKKLLPALKESPFPNGLLIATDNDEPGREGAARWAEAIQAAGASCKVVDTAKLYGACKDANELLQKAPERLRNNISELYASEMQVINPWAAGIESLLENVNTGIYEPIPTGIESIDAMLGGGFMAKQLVVIGAPPAMGKTALNQMIVETMALNNPDFTAMYFCFEMSRDQLQARSISRLLHRQGVNLTALEVLRGKFGWQEGARIYKKEIAGKVAYFGLGNGLHSCRLEDVLHQMQEGVRYNAFMGKPAPFIVIDYLQLVDVDGKDEMDAIKATVAALKEFAVKHDSVVIAVAANNRESNKNKEISMYAGRGSSSIEYGCDISLAMTYTDYLERKEHVENKKRRSLVVTKGRFIGQDARADFEFNGRYSDFLPVDTWGTATPAADEAAINDLIGFTEPTPEQSRKRLKKLMEKAHKRK